MRRILVSASLSPRRLPLSISRRACISSISALSSARPYFKPRGSSPNSSLAVNSGLNNNIENILSNGPPNTPSNNSPEKNPSQDGKYLLQVLQVLPLISTLRSSDAFTAVPEAHRLWCAAWRRSSDSNYSKATGFA